MSTLSPKEAAKLSRRLYAEGPFIARKLQGWRPYICPFGPLIDAIPSGARVLDIGCGSGLFLGLLSAVKRIREGVGFDSSSAAIALANTMRNRVEGSDRLTFLHRAVENTWPEGAFDTVTMIDVMHHVPRSHRREVVTSAAAHTAPGGIFLYKDIATRPRWRAWANRLHDLIIAREWISYTDFRDIADWAAAAGLALEETNRINMLWYSHEWGVFRRPGKTD